MNNDRQIVITRMFNAPRADVFDAWTNPAEVSQWFDPSGAPLAVCEIDLRPGGAFRWVNRAGAEQTFAGTYREITPPERLVFTVQILRPRPDPVGTLVFTELGRQTKLTMTIQCASVEDRDALLAMRVDQGTARTLDNLDRYLGKVTSKDGTTIGFERIGHGPAVILVDGALSYRDVGQSRQLGELLAPHFTVFTFDRRGRGGSGDGERYAVEREVEDIAAILERAGGSAFIWGMSSGAVLALEAANHLSGIRKVAVYEAPLIVDDSRPTTENDWIRIGDAVAAGRRSDAVRFFLRSVGVPTLVIAMMRFMPLWSKLKAIAHTLPYDGAIVKDLQRGKPLPANRWASVKVPALVMDGGNSALWMRRANESLAAALPNARYLTLAGQTHMLKPKAHVEPLVEFFKG